MIGIRGKKTEKVNEERQHTDYMIKGYNQPMKCDIFIEFNGTTISKLK